MADALGAVGWTVATETEGIMPLLTCPTCDKKLKIPDRLAGKMGQCPGCKGRIRIPELDSGSPEEDFERVEDEDDRAARRIVSKRDVRKRDEDEDRPRRSRYRDEEDEDDRPARQSFRKDDEDDRPGRRSRDRDDDEDDRPSRRRSRDDDSDDAISRRVTKAVPRRKRRRRRRDDGDGFLTPGMKLGLMIGGGVLLLLLLLSVVVPLVAFLPVMLGFVLMSGGGIWFIIVAFKDDVMQGLLCWMIPAYQFYYLLQNWEEEKYPFLTQVAGFLLVILWFCAGAVNASIWSAAAH